MSTIDVPQLAVGRHDRKCNRHCRSCGGFAFLLLRMRTPDTQRPTLAGLRRSPLYSEALGIELARGTDREAFKWLLASMLFGERISEAIAANTYRAFARHRVVTPRTILAAGPEFLVEHVMREGGYTRFDERKAEQIVRTCLSLVTTHRGRLSEMHRCAEDAADLERHVTAFPGVGPVTANIFLRELRPWWRKAEPEPLPVVATLARRYRIPINDFGRHTITFTRIEAGLIRLRKVVGGVGG